MNLMLANCMHSLTGCCNLKKNSCCSKEGLQRISAKFFRCIFLAPFEDNIVEFHYIQDKSGQSISKPGQLKWGGPVKLHYMCTIIEKVFVN